MSLDHTITMIWDLLSDATLKTTILLFLAWSVSRLLPKNRAGWHSMLWSLTLLAAILMPLLISIMPKVEVAILPPAAPSPVAPYSPTYPPILLEDNFAPIAGSGNLSTPSPETSVPVPETIRRPEFNSFSSLTWIDAVIGLYAIGIMFFLLKILAGYHRIRRIRQHASTYPEGETVARAWCNRLGLKTTVPVAISSSVSVPTVVGFIRPLIILPDDARTQYSGSIMDGIFIHELAHIKRHDPVWNLISRFATAMYWFHPLIYLSCRALSDAHEQACDDWAVTTLGDSDAYAGTLLDVVSQLTRPEPLYLAVGMARTASVLDRVERIMTLGGRVSPGIGRVFLSILVSGTLISSVMLGSLEAVQRLANEAGLADQDNVGSSVVEPPEDRFARAVEFSERYKYREAVLILEALLKENPDDIRSYIRIADLLNSKIELGKMYFNSLRRRLSEEIDSSKIDRLALSEADRLFLSAIDLRREQNYDEVIAAMQARVALDETNRTYRFDLARMLDDVGRIDDAITLFESMNTQYPADANIMHALARGYLRAERFDEALRMLDQALRIRPQEARWLTTLGNVYQQTDQPERAISAYEKSAYFDAEDYETWFNLGTLYQKLGHSRASGRAFTKTKLKTHYEPMISPRRWKLILDDEGDSPEVRQRIEREIDQVLQDLPLEATNTRTILHVSNLLKELGYHDRADSLLDSAIARDPEGNFARMIRYQEIAEQRDPNVRALMLEEFIKTDPDKTSAFMRMASLLVAYSEAKDLEGIRRTVDRLLGVDPDELRYVSASSMPHSVIVSTLAEHGIDLDRAEELALLENERTEQRVAPEGFENVTDVKKKLIAGTIASARLRLAYVYLKQERYDLAEQIYKEAIALKEQSGDPVSSYIWKQMGQLYEAQGKSEEAIGAYKNALSLIKTDDVITSLTTLYEQQGKSRSEIETLLANAMPEETPHVQVERKVVVRWTDRISEFAPSFSLEDLAGRPVALADYTDRIVVLNFWAAWSASSRWSMDQYQAIHDRFKDDDVAFLAISIDDTTSVGEVAPLVTENGYTFTVLHDREQSTMSAYEVEHPATVFIIDQTGTIQFRHSGFSRENIDRIYAEVQALLDGAFER